MSDPLPCGGDEWLLLRGRYIQLVRALDQTPQWNAATLAALGQILPSPELPARSVDGHSRISWPLKEAGDQSRVAA